MQMEESVMSEQKQLNPANSNNKHDHRLTKLEKQNDFITSTVLDDNENTKTETVDDRAVSAEKKKEDNSARSSLTVDDATGSMKYNFISGLDESLKQELNLQEADNIWRPRVFVKSTDVQVDPSQKAQLEKEEFLRCVRGILNKLTPENFEPLAAQLIKLRMNTCNKVNNVATLVAEKAFNEPDYSVVYARLCGRLITAGKSCDKCMQRTNYYHSSLRNCLLHKTEREFFPIGANPMEKKLKSMREKISCCKDAHEKVLLETLLDEEELKVRQRSISIVSFLGELFNVSLITGKIINNCIERLLKNTNNEVMFECLCKLLIIVGQRFERTPLSANRYTAHAYYSLRTVIRSMQNIIEQRENSKISSRVRFLFQDVIDLRKNQWRSTIKKTPMTRKQNWKKANKQEL